MWCVILIKGYIILSEMREELKKYIRLSGKEMEIKRASTIEGIYVYNIKGESVFRIHDVKEKIIPINKIKDGYVMVVSLKSKISVVSPLFNLFG